MAHKEYIKYMEMVVKNPAYSGMPNATTNGRVNWQVSSGKTTSFFEYYEARWNWWKRKSDELGLPGAGNSGARFSVAARLIHPTGERPCRLCGRSFYVGYMYVSSYLEKRWNKLVGSKLINKGSDIVTAAEALLRTVGQSNFDTEIQTIFKEKFVTATSIESSKIRDFFVKTSHIRSYWLSPGYMANPPDRLDGFHDYCLFCRPKQDPGRSEENLRTYIHDRRAFQWWTEGDWKVADTLYNSAGPGVCDWCGKKLAKVSPDHVGPLSCGFKQIPFFIPLCQPHNSARNRRMRAKDIKRLTTFETSSGQSVASWQIRAYWNKEKTKVRADSQATKLSTFLRSIEDYYLRALNRFWKNGNCGFHQYFSLTAIRTL